MNTASEQSPAPLVSVIIPVYNRAGTIQRAVASVLAQTYRRIEVIVVDDGSTDSTVKQLESYGNRIRLIRQMNSGPGKARNVGIRATTGEIICFLDSDDAWLPEKLEHQVRLLERTSAHGVQCCVCNARMIAADGSEKTSFAIAGLSPEASQGVWTNPGEVLLTRFLFFNQTVAVRRGLLNQVGLFNENFRLLEDYDLALRLALTGPWAYIAEPLVIWHGGVDNSLSRGATEPEVILRTDEILAELQSSPRWSARLPSGLVRRRRKLLQRHLRVQNFCQHAPVWLGKSARFYLQVQKWLYYHQPLCPRMDAYGV